MSHSRVASFNGCPYQYKLKYIDQLEIIEKTEFQNDSAFGSAVHKGLEIHYKGGTLEEVLSAFDKSYPADLSPTDQAKSKEGGLICLEEYVKFYREQDKDWRVVAVEEKGVLKTENEEHNVVIDLVAEHIPSGSIYAWDHKTTSPEKMKYSFWKRFEVDAQITMYTEYIKQKYGKCSGFYINAIAVGHRKRKYLDQPAGYHQTFQRNLFERNDAQIEAWKRSDRDWKSLMDYAKAFNSYPKALSGLCCYCEFYALCLSGDDEQIKQIMYKKKEVA